jgi:hypothetical protein
MPARGAGKGPRELRDTTSAIDWLKNAACGGVQPPGQDGQPGTSAANRGGCRN